ncbi:response regulator transcription factor [Parachryseolinea silvisoli]|jgi:DNA-binding NarL/FixJ family response regulator|uniref:response regulator transcription factor n=1 Tax=Parachryseolinea silvisoli TaxID=2873601 RepID=UPI002265A6BE|nr:response regulator transcription factor [Parachryseolinea silvisoli]MCD9018475.1 response regulator transcription factor [Parachryseolinea silvisoli]
MPDQYSIVIVDDHALFAQALKTLINTFDKYHVLYHVKNGEELIEKLKSPENIPDICLLDINMPVMNGIETMQWLTRHKPQIKGLALSMDDEEATVIRMLRAGAHGYLLKDINPTVLQDAFRDVLEKGFYYSDKITNTVLSSLHRAEEEIVLKDREIEFLKLVCSEKTYKEIAADMFLSPKTIDGYREALFEKLQIKSRVGLVIYAIKNKVYKVE